MADQEEAFNKLNELLKTVTDPGLRASLQAQSNILAEEQGLEKKRLRPALWGKAYLVEAFGKREFDSPAALLRYLGISKSGAETMVQAFERVGFKVSSDGEPEKGLPFLVRRVSPTPMRPRGGTYRIEKPEIGRPPRRAEPPRVEEFETPYVVVRDRGGNIIRWENGRGRVLPQELWPKYSPIPPGELLVAEPGSLPMPPNLGPPLPRSMGIYWPWVTPPTHVWRRSTDPEWYYYKD